MFNLTVGICITPVIPNSLFSHFLNSFICSMIFAGSAMPSNIRPSTIARSSTNKQIGVANETHITISSGDALQRNSGCSWCILKLNG